MIQQRAKVSQPHQCKTMDFKKGPKTTCKDLDKLGMEESNEEIRLIQSPYSVQLSLTPNKW